MKQELKSLRYQLSSDALAKTFAGGKQVYKDGDTRLHSLEEEVPEETDEEKCFRADFATSTPKNTNTSKGSRPTNPGRGGSNSAQNGQMINGNSPKEWRQ